MAANVTHLTTEQRAALSEIFEAHGEESER